jgi:transposase
LDTASSFFSTQLNLSYFARGHYSYYILLSTLTDEGAKTIKSNPGRIKEVNSELEKLGVRVTAQYVTLGPGVSGRDMLEQLIAGQDDPTQLAQLARGQLRKKIADLERALTGHVRAVPRTLLRLHLEYIDDLNGKIAALSDEIDRLRIPFVPTNTIERLDAIPGVNATIAQVILSELGNNMSRFPTANHAAAWAGVAPGRKECAGRQRSARSRQGNPHLKAALIQAAHATGRRKNHYLGTQYSRIAARRGKQRAAIVVTHSILIIAYHMLQRGTEYVDLGADYFDKRNEQHIQRTLVKSLERPGLKVTLEPATLV